MNIDELQAGRELDALIAEKVMGFKSIFECAWYNQNGKCVDLPHYSTDIAAAWQVVEKVHAVNFLGVDTFQLYRVRGGFSACFGGSDYASADTAPLAICRAALTAIDGGLTT